MWQKGTSLTRFQLTSTNLTNLCQLCFLFPQKEARMMSIWVFFSDLSSLQALTMHHIDWLVTVVICNDQRYPNCWLTSKHNLVGKMPCQKEELDKYTLFARNQLFSHLNQQISKIPISQQKKAFQNAKIYCLSCIGSQEWQYGLRDTHQYD